VDKKNLFVKLEIFDSRNNLPLFPAQKKNIKNGHSRSCYYHVITDLSVRLSEILVLAAQYKSGNSVQIEMMELLK